MGHKTTYYSLNTVESAVDKLSDEDYKVLGEDRDTIDAALHEHAVHHHYGDAPVVDAPTVALELALADVTGNLKPSTRYYYRQTWIDGFANESESGPQAFIDTPDPVEDPDAPVLATQALGGSLASGSYYYVLSAYAPDSNRETLATNAAFVTAVAGSTNKNTITLPDLPDGAAGFNLYRKVPSGTGFFLLAIIDMDVATPPSEYVDDGSVAANTERTLPTVNTTNNDLSIQVCLGGATPAIPPSYLWRIYRTGVPDNWSISRLHTVADESLCWTDSGANTGTGAPPIGTSGDSPDQIQLTDALEVQGVLPPANVAYVEVVEFAFPGSLEVREGTFVWRCLYDEFYISYVTGNLGDLSMASGQEEIFDVLWQDNQAATPSWISIFDQATPVLPFIEIGEQLAAEFVPVHRKLVKGDFLKASIVQISDAATPLDDDLLIQIYGFAKVNEAVSIEFP